MSNTTFVTFTSVHGNVLKTKDVQAAANRFITPEAPAGKSYVESVLMAKTTPKAGSRYKRKPKATLSA